MKLLLNSVNVKFYIDRLWGYTHFFINELKPLHSGSGRLDHRSPQKFVRYEFYWLIHSRSREFARQEFHGLTHSRSHRFAYCSIQRFTYCESHGLASWESVYNRLTNHVPRWLVDHGSRDLAHCLSHGSHHDFRHCLVLLIKCCAFCFVVWLICRACMTHTYIS